MIEVKVNTNKSEGTGEFKCRVSGELGTILSELVRLNIEVLEGIANSKDGSLCDELIAFGQSLILTAQANKTNLDKLGKMRGERNA